MPVVQQQFPTHQFNKRLSLPWRACRCQIVNFYRLDRPGWFKAKHSRIKVKLAVERALDVLCLPESMLLTGKGDVRDRNSFVLQGRNHYFRLARRYDLVFQSLEEDH